MEREHYSAGFFMIGIAAVLIASILLLVVFGAHSFRGTAAGQDENNNARALGSYLSTVARYNDSAGAFSLSDDPTYGQVLLLADGSSGYGLHIYQYEGKLMEDYASLESSPVPERSQVIAETGIFEVQKSGNLFEIYTDAGRVLLHQRSGGDAS